MEIADWAPTSSTAGDRGLAARRRHGPALCRNVAHRRRQPVAGGSQDIVGQIEGKGLKISGLGFYPNPLHPDPAVREPAIDHIKKVIVACRLMGVPFMNTFMGGDSKKDLDDNWQALRVWPDIVRHARDNGVKLTIENCPMIFSRDEWPGGNNIALVALHLAAHPRAVGRHGRPQLRPVAPRLADDRPGPLHPRIRAAHPASRKDVQIDRDGLYERGSMSSGIGWQIPRLPGLGDADWTEIFSNLYRVGYDGDCIIEHEDRRFEGTDELVKAWIPARPEHPAAVHPEGILRLR